MTEKRRSIERGRTGEKGLIRVTNEMGVAGLFFFFFFALPKKKRRAGEKGWELKGEKATTNMLHDNANATTRSKGGRRRTGSEAKQRVCHRCFLSPPLPPSFYMVLACVLWFLCLAFLVFFASRSFDVDLGFRDMVPLLSSLSSFFEDCMAFERVHRRHLRFFYR